MEPMIKVAQEMLAVLVVHVRELGGIEDESRNRTRGSRSSRRNRNADPDRNMVAKLVAELLLRVTLGRTINDLVPQEPRRRSPEGILRRKFARIRYDLARGGR